jgi:hypothetical protein
MDQLMAVADAGKLVPPKSTWFEPKLAYGLLSHVLDSKTGARGTADGSAERIIRWSGGESLILQRTHAGRCVACMMVFNPDLERGGNINVVVRRDPATGDMTRAAPVCRWCRHARSPPVNLAPRFNGAAKRIG